MPRSADFTPSTEDATPPPHADYRLDPRLRTLYLLRHGLVLGKESARLTIHWQGKRLETIPAIHVDQIMIFGNAQISTQAMRFCLAERIPVYLLSASGRYYGVVDSFDTEPVLLHKAQFEKAEDTEFCLRLARNLIRGKIANSRTLLKRLSRKRPAEALEKAAWAPGEFGHCAAGWRCCWGRTTASGGILCAVVVPPRRNSRETVMVAAA